MRVSHECQNELRHIIIWLNKSLVCDDINWKMPYENAFRFHRQISEIYLGLRL